MTFPYFEGPSYTTHKSTWVVLSPLSVSEPQPAVWPWCAAACSAPSRFPYVDVGVPPSSVAPAGAGARARVPPGSCRRIEGPPSCRYWNAHGGNGLGPESCLGDLQWNNEPNIDYNENVVGLPFNYDDRSKNQIIDHWESIKICHIFDENLPGYKNFFTWPLFMCHGRNTTCQVADMSSATLSGQ